MVDFEKNTKLVYFVFEKKFKNYSDLKDDLCQEGLIALWKASKKYNKQMGLQFSTYAVKSIYNNMLRYIQNKEIKHIKNSITFSELEAQNVDLETLKTNNYDFTKLQVEMFIKKSKQKERNKKIMADYLLTTEKQTEISQKYSISKSCFYKVIHKFSDEIRSQL